MNDMKLRYYSFIAAALLAAPYILDILFNFKELIKATFRIRGLDFKTY